MPRRIRGVVVCHGKAIEGRDALHDGQPQAGRVRSGILLAKPLEKLCGFLLRRQGGAGIGDDQLGGTQLHRNRPPGKLCRMALCSRLLSSESASAGCSISNGAAFNCTSSCNSFCWMNSSSWLSFSRSSSASGTGWAAANCWFSILLSSVSPWCRRASRCTAAYRSPTKGRPARANPAAGAAVPAWPA